MQVVARLRWSGGSGMFRAHRAPTSTPVPAPSSGSLPRLTPSPRRPGPRSQTGSGKTHSMLGTAGDPGIIPRAVDDIFTAIEDATTATPPASAADASSGGGGAAPAGGGADGTASSALPSLPSLPSPPEYLLRVSYLEVYNEEVHDLLAVSGGRREGAAGI
jgi:hypothetical protein